jgi:hypothetical protein
MWELQKQMTPEKAMEELWAIKDSAVILGKALEFLKTGKISH